MVSLEWVTYPEERMWKNGLIMMGDLPKWKECEVRSHYNGWPTQMEDRKNMEWSHCYGWPTQVEDRKNMKWSHCYGWPTQVERIWKAVSLWWVTYPNGKNVKCGLIIMGDLPRKNDGLIVMGDLPRKMMFFFQKMVSLLRVTYPKTECDLPGKKTWLEQSWQDKVDKLGTF
jgi:hypothetical protein